VLVSGAAAPRACATTIVEMGCASSSDAAERTTPASDRQVDGAMLPLVPPEAPALDDVRKRVSGDPTALRQAPPPGAHTGLLDDSKSRDIDRWIDSMGIDADPNGGEADPDFDINAESEGPPLSTAALRQHETSMMASFEASHSQQHQVLTGQDAALLPGADGDEVVSLRSAENGNGRSPPKSRQVLANPLLACPEQNDDQAALR